MEQYLLKHIKYDPETGKITRSDRKGGLGSYDKDGYLIIKVKGKQYKSHRLAWFLHYGKFPEKEIDHINRVRDDNRITNLREVDRTENTRNHNRKPNPKTGFVGIHYDESTQGLKSKYTTRIDGKTYRFKTLQEAVNKRRKHGLITKDSDRIKCTKEQI